MMNFAYKAAFSIPKTNLFQLQVALFHSSPVLERKRRNFCDASHRSNNRFKNYSRRSRRLNANEALLRNIGAYADHLFQSHRSNNYSRRSNRLNAKEALLCNISSYVDHLFQSWHDGFDQEDPSSSSGPSWFRQQYTKGSRRGMNDNQRTTSSSKKGFHFCEEDDVDVDNIFRSTFGGNRYFHWSFVNDENPQWKNTSGYYSYSYGKNQRYRVEDEYDYSSESDHDGSESNFASDRLALGLRAYGPLKLEDVKNAYRSCALKWHPDRHQGSSKVLGDVIESLAGAILVDSGYNKEVVFQSIRPLLEPLITPETLRLQPVRELNELCQKQHFDYKKPVVSRNGRNASVTIEVEANGRIFKHTATVADKNTAKKLASKEVLKALKESNLVPLKI